MAQEVGSAYVTIMPSTKGLQGEIQTQLGDAFDGSLQKAEGRFRSFFGKVAAAGAAVLATIGIGKLAKNTIELGVQYNALEQSSRAAFTTILGSADAAAKMQDQIRAFAKTSPFPRQAFIEGTQQLLGFGLQADKVIPALQAIQDSVAAVGGNADTISQITYALAQMRGQGKLTGETLNQLGQFGIDAASLIGGQMGKTSAEIRDMASKPGGIPADQVWDPLIDALEGRFAGAAAGVKNTWVGSVDRIKGAWRDIASALVEPFVSKSGGGLAVQWANDFATQLRKLEPLVGPAMSKLVGWLEKVGPQLQTAVTSFSPFLIVLDVLKGLLPQIAVPLRAVGRAIVDAFVSTGPVVTQLLATLSVLIQDLAPVIVQVGSALGIVLEAGLSALLPPLLQLVSSLLPLLIPLFETVLSVVQAMVPVVLAVQDAWYQLVGDALTSFVSLAGTTLVPLLASLASFLSEHADLVLVAVGAYLAWKVAVGAIDLVKLIAGVVTSTASWVTNTAAVVANTAATIASKVQTAALMALYAKDFVVGLVTGTGRWIANTAAIVANRVAMIAHEAAQTPGAILTLAKYVGLVTAEWIRNTAALVANKAQAVAAFAVMSAQGVAAFAKMLPALVAQTAAWVANTAAQVAAKVAIMASAVAQGVLTAAQWLLNAAMDANPIGLIILAIAALVAAIVWLVANWDAVTKFLTEAWQNVSSFFMTIGEAISNWWNGLWTGISSWVMSIWTGIVSWVIGVWQNFQLGLQVIGNAVASWWNGLWSGIGSFISSVWNGFIGWVTSRFQLFLLGIQIIGQAISTWWNGLWNGISSFFVGVWNNIVGVVNTIGTAFSNAFSGLGSIIKGAFEGVVSFVKGIINGIIDVVNGVIDGINTVANGVKTISGGAIDIHLGKIPHLAEGGIVTARPGGILANIGEGRYDELVMPITPAVRRALEGGGEGSSGQPVHQTFNIHEATDASATAREVVRQIVFSGA